MKAEDYVADDGHPSGDPPQHWLFILIGIACLQAVVAVFGDCLPRKEVGEPVAHYVQRVRESF